MQQVFPHIAFRREVTVGHLLLDTDCECAVHAKVNPPIRPREDVEALWQAVLDRKIDWIVSDHACCSSEQKWSKDDPSDIWLAKAGFGGTEYLLSGVVSEGGKRGMSYNRMAELLAWNPARRFGLLNKGDIAPGFDADIALVDPHESFVVRAAESESKQGYSPFEGQELSGRVKSTFLRGALIYHQGEIVGPARGQYLRRPLKLSVRYRCAGCGDKAIAIPHQTKHRIVGASFQNLHVVLCDQRLDRSVIAVVDAIDIDEVVGEPPRDHGQKQVRILRSDIAERVGNIARTDHDGPSGGCHLLLADGDFELPVQNIEYFALMAMNMKRRPVSRRYLLLQNGVRPARFLAHDLERALVTKHADHFPLSGSPNDRNGRFRLGEKFAHAVHLKSRRAHAVRGAAAPCRSCG